MASNLALNHVRFRVLQTVRGHGKYRSPIELLTVCRALHVARSCRFGLSFLVHSKTQQDYCQRNEKKNQPFLSPERLEAGQKPEHLIGGSILLSKGGSIQMSVEATESNVTVVPSEAIQTGQEGQYVFVVKQDLTVESTGSREIYSPQDILS
jgi:hypothetical protein